MSDFLSLIEKLTERQDLLSEEVVHAAHALADPDVSEAEKEQFLTALAEKGETAGEVAAFARTFRSLARDPEVGEWSARAIDVCGTGGDKMGTFNISTTVMFVLAAGGIPVFKHGNRSITSQCGSADLLAMLGVPMEADLATFHRSLRELNFTFFFAPNFHPAFKAIMPARHALAKRGQRSIFNVLGPLINPGRPAYQLLGVFSEAWMPALASALDEMELKNGFIAHCRLDDGRGMDELSCVGINRLLGFGKSRDCDEELRPEQVGLDSAVLEDLAGGDADRNCDLFHKIVAGEGPKGLIDSILLNAGVGFYTAEKVDGITEGIALARDLLSSGAVKNHVKKTVEFYHS